MRAALSALLLVAGCDPSAIALVVDVRTDLVPGVELARVEVAIPAEGETQWREVGADLSTREPFRVAEWDALAPSASRRLTVTAFAPDGSVTAQRTALVDHRSSRSVQVVLTRSCRAVRCDAAQTCLGGVCVDERCLTGEEPECPGGGCADCEALSACDAPRCEREVCLHEAVPDACEGGLVCAPAEGCRAAVDPDGGGPDLDAGLVGADAGRDAALPLDAALRPDAAVDAGPSVCRAGAGCDFVLQDCPMDEACVPRTVGGVVVGRCESAGAGMDSVCASTADCAPGWDCISLRCVEVCCPGAGLSACSVGGAVCTTLAGMLAGLCLFDECDLPSQAGCGAGEGCYEVTEGVFSCLAAGDALRGEACEGENDCGPLLSCGTDLRCTPTCDDALLPCAMDETCLDLGGRDFGQCQLEGCDPIAQTGCPAQACYATGPAEASCFPEGTLPLGSACSTFTGCADGATCAGGFCRAVCIVGEGCASGSCVAISGWAPWGACV